MRDAFVYGTSVQVWDGRDFVRVPLDKFFITPGSEDPQQREGSMEKVTAYKASDGSIHKTREGAACASLLKLATSNSGASARLSHAEAQWIVDHRRGVTEILRELDTL